MSNAIKRLIKGTPSPHYTLFGNDSPHYKVNGLALGSPFVPGHKLSTREAMSEESNRRRAAGMMKMWRTKALQRQGVKVVTDKQKKEKVVRQRAKLKETLALEARQVVEVGRKSASKVMKMLEEIVENKHERASDRIAAGAVLLDRTYGKALQTSANLNVDANGKATDVTRKELTTRIEESLKRVEELTSGAPEKRPRKERPADIRKHNGDPGSSSLH